MGHLHRFLENAGLIAMALWLLGSVLYALPSVALRRRLERHNAGRWWANWTVFGAGRRRAEIERYLLRYRDTGDGRAGAWAQALHGRRWVWHSFLWQPERRLADRVQRIGRDISHVLEQRGGQTRIVEPLQALLAAHLERACPRPRGFAREVQLVEEHAVADAQAREGEAGVTTTRVILEFTLPAA